MKTFETFGLVVLGFVAGVFFGNLWPFNHDTVRIGYENLKPGQSLVISNYISYAPVHEPKPETVHSKRISQWHFEFTNGIPDPIGVIELSSDGKRELKRLPMVRASYEANHLCPACRGLILDAAINGWISYRAGLSTNDLVAWWNDYMDHAHGWREIQEDYEDAQRHHPE